MFCIHLIFCPKPALMRLNNGSANIQSHAHTIVFCTKKGLKHPLNDGFSNSGACISYLDSEHGGEGAGV
jgi:hypothetical protein